jgi:WD40 repeat protein
MQEPPKVTLDMLQDVYKFTLEFFTPISTAALHIYHSAIPFTPRSSLIRQRVGVVDMNGIVAVTNGAEQVWTRCLRVLEGHAYGISSVALSSDGRLVASGSGSNDGAVVQFWDTVTGVNLRTLPSDSPINSLDFSPDSKLLISGSSDFTVRLWDAVTGTVLNQIKGHVGRVRSVAFSPSGRRLISGSDDCTIRVWDAAVGTALKLIVNQSAVGSAKFDHSEESIVAHFEHDSAVRQFDLASGDIVKTMTSASGSIRAVTLSYDGKLIISASAHTIQVWDAITGAALKSIKGPSSFISLGFAPSGKFFASGDHDSNIRVWDVRRGANLKTFEGHMGAVTSVAFSPNEQVLVSSSDDRTIRFWDAANNATVTRRTLNAHKYRVNCIALSPDGKLIASASDDQTIKTWDAVSGAVLKAIKGHTAGVNAVSFSPDNKLLVSGSADGTLRLWNAVTGVAIRIVNVKPRGTGSEISAVAFSPGGKYIISGGMGYIVRMWDVSTTTGHHFRSYSTNASHVHCVSFSSDGALIIAGCSDNALYSWDVRTGDAIKIFRGHSDAVNLATFSPDMRLVISRSWDNTIRLWDRVTGDLVKTFKTYGDSTTLIEQTNPDPANTTRRNDQNIRNADDWVGYTCGSDGWVVRMTETEARRICWIPKAARPDEHHRSLSVFNGNKFAFATASNVVVLLDFSTV